MALFRDTCPNVGTGASSRVLLNPCCLHLPAAARRLADYLGKAGRASDSAHSYLKAAEYIESDSFELKRLAADQLMRSGHIDEAMVLFRELSIRIGLKMPTNPRNAMWGIICWRVLTRVRLSFNYPTPHLRSITDNDRLRLELLRTGGIIMNTADPVLAAYLQARHVYASLKVRRRVPSSHCDGS